MDSIRRLASYERNRLPEAPDRPSSHPGGDPDNSRRSKSRWRRCSRKIGIVLKRHLAFIGPGIVASVAYSDPGNWVTDLAAGSQFGYALNFTILLCGLIGIFLQILAVRMGVVTGEDLARNARLLCLPEGPDGELRPDLRWRKTRKVCLWLCYLISEGALIATELAELIGSAIALNLLFPALPVWGGVIITCLDVFIILAVYKPAGNFRIFEWFVGGLVLTVLACYIALLVRSKPDWGLAFKGFIPSRTLIGGQALYTSIGIMGAVIMPHSLFLGSHFATIHRLRDIRLTDEKEDDKVAKLPESATTRDIWKARLRRVVGMIDADLVDPEASKKVECKRFTIAQMKIQIPHASVDIALSLFFFAITINSAILIVAAAAFYYGRGTVSLGDLYDAFALLRSTLGEAYAVLFAIALLAAGQSASITCTLAGQLVSEGFIKWKTNPFVRRLITRMITIVPSLAIAIAVGRDGLDEALIASQVALSFALPFVLVPLIVVTSMKSKMLVTEDVDTEAEAGHARDMNQSTIDPGYHDGQAIVTTSSASTSGLNTPHNSARPIDSIAKRNEKELTADAVRHSDPSVAIPSQTAKTPACEQVSPQPLFDHGHTSSIRTISHDFTNPWYIMGVAGLVYLAIVLADLYTLVTTINPSVGG